MFKQFCIATRSLILFIQAATAKLGRSDRYFPLLRSAKGTHLDV
jgi:hypothetical protein